MTLAEQRKIEATQAKRDAEESYKFLLPENLKDAEGRRPSDPDYDGRTLYIPKEDWRGFTPFERQFWEIKQNHYDTVLFFQKGKFFELYEGDAQIGHDQFDLKLTKRVKMQMVGVPEQSFDEFAAKFLAHGYKVGKVEQVETAIGAELRRNAGKGSSTLKEDKIVQRELAQIFTNGTIVDGAYLSTHESNHCVAVKEQVDPNGTVVYGVCVLDASTGEFQLTALEDDVLRTKLGTLFRQIRPKELLHAKGNLSSPTLRLLRNISPPNVLWQDFKDGVEFYPVAKTLEELGKLFEVEGDLADMKATLPNAIKTMLNEPLAIEALGGMLFYLRSLNLDKDLVSQGNFTIFDPTREGKVLILDGQSLGHMEILINNEGGHEGTLLSLLQNCVTPSGKRLFRMWITAPLCEVRAINDRLDAVDDIMHHPDFAGMFTSSFKNLPDLERLVSRAHAGSMRQKDFLTIIEGFQTVSSTLKTLVSSSSSFSTSPVPDLLRGAPDLNPLLQHMRTLYHVVQEGKTIDILPTQGSDRECDQADANVAEQEGILEQLREKARKQLHLARGEIAYWHSNQGGKEIYQLQVAADVEVPSSWRKQSGTKTVSRYYNSEITPVIRKLQEEREMQSVAKKTFFRRLLQKFDQSRREWLNAVKTVAELDCLVSLAKASSNMDEPKCRPVFINSPEAFIDFTELRHPSMCLRADFIANDVRLGKSEPRTVLLTGPNMAGKSTLLRMTASAVIMAQLGCYVPSASATLSPIDRIQTRMGAYDNMFASASTYKVELDECSKILREAGPKSLVILDELGRGTSTHDGMAIAMAVLHHLATHTLPLGFFATHYGLLADEFLYHPNIRNMHMQTHVDEDLLQVVFLYKLIPGVAESSHGTHVAHMAGVPTSVVTRAQKVSAEFFDDTKKRLATRRKTTIPLTAQADFSWLIRLAMGQNEETTASLSQRLKMVTEAIGGYDLSG
ncbi:hypothetical protein TREMEDRAFT_40008 [Tremella mesenterica DSM 1558]|uniref:uncharacterized protein n=1 Tax=Tremella mesenterica (strain ATCC 24925 / CBS 8224 / DSM 1558 / NBRC 9311 / NRRL Y-6157 / RJB 2259-6 / UBC 559-6) TaxID=578456 RepID=UPI0003F49DF4|nr:uncharacterized protein TREMEDRAFT_40008 [Tremella mesenterica DSM 1558]EIW67861.1 hypothetical protein TREMEDRAFT_40008 [Tremella mesenterica DSM 1558]